MSKNDSTIKSQKVEVAEGKVLYNVVRDAFHEAEMIFYPNPHTIVNNNNNDNNSNTKGKNNNDSYHFVIKNDRAVLVWFDTIRDLDYFSIIKPWQVVNRLPQANVICRKAPFVRIIHRVQPLFPNLYTFLPKSYILPIQKDKFIQAVAKHDRKHIIKPDNGSLGAGITILEKSMCYSPSPYLAIAQEYAESYLIDQTKFDLRIYCLVSSINPLNIYVYRGGVARFCSQPVDSNDSSLFSQITNTAVNRTNPQLQKIDSITQMVNSVFEKMKTKDNVDIDALWKRIDKAITLTVLAAYGYLLQGEEEVCKPCGYSRCFQIFGFDVLIDQSLNPILLEVNYRPSLETDTPDENLMKRDMLSTAMKIAAPLNEVQDFIRSKFITNTSNSSNFDPHNGDFTISDSDWKQKVNVEFANHIQTRRQNILNENQGKFVQTYPCLYDDDLNKQYNAVIEKVQTLPTSYENKYKLPVEITCYKNYITTEKINASSHLPPINQKPNQQNEKPHQTISNQQKLPQQSIKPKEQTQINKQQNKPIAQNNQKQQSKPITQNKQTTQINQTQQNKQSTQNKQIQPIKQTTQNKQTQQNKQPLPNNQNQKNNQIQQNKQNQIQNKQTQQQQKQTIQNTQSHTANINKGKEKTLFPVKEPTSVTTKPSKNQNPNYESANHTLARSDRPHPVTRSSSVKVSQASSSSSQTQTKSIISSKNINNKTLNPRKTSVRDSISNSKSSGTVNKFSATNSKIGNKDNIRASASQVRPSIRSSNRGKQNIVTRKSDTLKLSKPQFSKV